MATQLDFFEETSDISLLKREMEKLKLSYLKSNRAYFAQLNEISKLCLDQAKELEKLKQTMPKEENIVLVGQDS